LNFLSATTTVSTGFCKIRVGIVLSYVVDLSILPGSMSFVTLRCGLACLTVYSIDCGVRIGVHSVLKTGCRLICEPSTAAWSALCRLPSSTLTSAFPSCGMRALGTQRLNVLVPLMGTFETVRQVRPASRVELASQARYADGRTAGAFRALTTLSG
jgi:hypothetical protein